MTLGRPPIGDRAMTDAERQARHREHKREPARRRPYVEQVGDEWFCVTKHMTTVHPSRRLAFEEMLRSRNRNRRPPMPKRRVHELRVRMTFPASCSETEALRIARIVLGGVFEVTKIMRAK
jgi:hypothetical protein